MGIKTYSVNTATGSMTPMLPLAWCTLKRRPRGTPPTYEPDETIFQDNPFGDTIGNGIPFQIWWPTCYRVNANNPGAMMWLGSYEAMFFNNDQSDTRQIDKDQPVNIRCSSSGGNLKAYYPDTQTATHIQIVAFDYRFPELANGKDFYSHPWLFTFPTAINASGDIHKVANGINVFVPQVCRPQGLWIRKSEVLFLNSQPTSWGIENVMGIK
jgi:hypothetical protein